MPKTDHWRNDHEGPLPYVETEEYRDRLQTGGGGWKEAVAALAAKVEAQQTELEALKNRQVAPNQVTKKEFDALADKAASDFLTVEEHISTLNGDVLHGTNERQKLDARVDKLSTDTDKRLTALDRRLKVIEKALGAAVLLRETP